MAIFYLANCFCLPESNPKFLAEKTVAGMARNSAMAHPSKLGAVGLPGLVNIPKKDWENHHAINSELSQITRG